MALAQHCDAEGCDTWSTAPQEHGFVTVVGQGLELHFCCLDHAGRYLIANSSPIEVIE
jgi:hypothetical protein